MNNKIVVLGIVTLLFAMSASVVAALPPNTVWFEPENSSAEYCNTTDVDILLNATEGVVGFDIWIEYDPCCANITKAAPGDFPSMFLVKYDKGATHIIGASPSVSDITGERLKLATITIHCENEGYCTTLLDLNESCKLGNQSYGNPPAIWHDGTFSCRDNEKPDLVITDKYETLVNDTIMVTYTVANKGAGDAGASNTSIAVAGFPAANGVVEDPVPPLAAGENYTSTVGTFECPCGRNVTVLVCADYDNVVDEEVEENNCLENEFECPPCHEPGIEVNKTVWDPVNEEWVDEIYGAGIGDIYKFKCEVQNTGDVNLTNIRFWDLASCSLEFAGNMTIKMEIGNVPIDDTLVPPYPFKPKILHPANLSWDPYAPISNGFNELCPEPDKKYHLSSWEDTNGDGKLSHCDQIDMEGEKVVDQWQVKSVTSDALQNEPLKDYQSFVPTVSTLDAVRVALWGEQGNVTVAIYNSNRIPIGSSTLQLGALGDKNTPVWVQFHFITPVELIPNETYYIELTTDGDYHWFYWDKYELYPRGQGWRDGTSYPNMDWTFITEYYGKTWYHVELLPYTLKLTSTEPDGVMLYFDSERDHQEIDLSNPWETQWEEVCCCKDSYELVNWTDTQNPEEPGYGILSECDLIVLSNNRTGEATEYHVEEVTIDLVVSREWSVNEYCPRFVLTRNGTINDTIVIEADARVVDCGADRNVQYAKGKYDGKWFMDWDDAWINTPGKPDLVIRAKYEEWVSPEDKTYNITYTVCNKGEADAGVSNTTITIDGVDVMEDAVPALAAGKCYTNTVGPFTMSGTNDTIVVCADNQDEVNESDEENNCLENVFESIIPKGGIGTAVTPRFNTVNSSVNLSIKIVNTENFDDVFLVSLTNESIPNDWKADLAWFNWTSKEVAIPAGGEVLIPLRADVPTGVPAGKKAFRVVVESTLWTPTVFDTGFLEIK
ncbi:MAG: CARDB domain-containing protein [Halobacteriota archaeon]